MISSYYPPRSSSVSKPLASPTREAASDLLRDGLQPNLILVDAQMPLMNGYAFLVWLMDSELWRHIPVVIWTGAISDQEVTRYYRAGANSLLLKQDAMKDVETFCRYWLKLAQLPQLVFSTYS